MTKKKRSYSESHEIVLRNISKVAWFHVKPAAELANDLVEVSEDLERLRPIFAVLMDESSKKQAVKAALLELNAWAWHTADHLNNIFAILDAE
jgi:hypothetical protein